jgi:DNA-binding response OmpR family regulator
MTGPLAPLPGKNGGTPVVLVVEDEPVLRASMVRGLARMPGIEVVDGATMAEATRLVEACRPALIISDLSLPDGTGEELIGVLDRLRMRVPIIFITAYLGAFQSRIPRRTDIEIHEKPVSLERLRGFVEARLRVDADARRATADEAPFAMVDYLQIACIGAHSVSLTLEERGRVVGTIEVNRGELWSARDAFGAGEAAFQRIFARDALRGTDTFTRCRSLRAPAGRRDVTTNWQVLMLESACAIDEGQQALLDLDEDIDASLSGALESVESVVPAPPAPPPQPAPPPGPPEPPPEPPRDRDAERFAAAFDAGVEALLGRDFHTAYDRFLDAAELRPDDPRVRANLQRLRDLGFAPGGRG